MPEVGSSRITTVEPPTKAMPQLSRRFIPPLNVAAAEVDEAIGIFDAALADVAATL